VFVACTASNALAAAQVIHCEVNPGESCRSAPCSGLDQQPGSAAVAVSQLRRDL